MFSINISVYRGNLFAILAFGSNLLPIELQLTAKHIGNIKWQTFKEFYMVSSGKWAMVSGYKFLTFHLYLWQASSELAASEVLEVGCCFRTYSVCDVTAAVSSWRLIGNFPAWALIG